MKPSPSRAKRRAVTVAVTGMNARPDNPGPGLAVARCLKESRHLHARVLGLAYDAFDPGLYLPQWSDESHLMPYPSAGEETYMARLAGLHQASGFDVLLPCLDAELPTLSRLVPWLEEQGVATMLPTAEQIRLRSKDRLNELADEAKIDCPETKSVFREDFFADAADAGFDYPLVVKGLFYDARIAHTQDEAVAAFRRIAGEWGLPVLVQKFAAGEEINLTGIGDGEGRLIGAVMMKKRALTDKGKAWAGISIHDEALLAAARRLVAATRWRGPLEVEVMRGADGRFSLIEINPRFPAWIYLSVGVGQNLPETLVRLALGEKLAEPPPAPAGILFIRYAQEVIVPLSDFEAMVTTGGLYA
ncbi:MAG: ATP-grasp domain-containing protein [Rhodocyclaceae bacterium]|nr:ATP-grasp domain-containing protein [Rhodocyclaceae bacterium]